MLATIVFRSALVPLFFRFGVSMAETHQVVTKVWIAPGCIVCDACENDCPEVFDVQEETCLIRPPAMNAEFLKPLTPSIIIASEGCPVDVIKFDTVEVEGKAPWADLPAGEPVALAGGAALMPRSQVGYPAGAGAGPAPDPQDGRFCLDPRRSARLLVPIWRQRSEKVPRSIRLRKFSAR